jgi:hypothetical protein
MSLRRKLFAVWCGFTVVWWLVGIFGGDGTRLVLKFRVGGWRAASVLFVMTLVMAVGIPLTILLLGRAAFWSAGQLARRRMRTRTDSNQDRDNTGHQLKKNILRTWNKWCTDASIPGQVGPKSAPRPSIVCPFGESPP